MYPWGAQQVTEKSSSANAPPNSSSLTLITQAGFVLQHLEGAAPLPPTAPPRPAQPRLEGLHVGPSGLLRL